LNLPPGAYAISAKTVIADDASAGSVYVFCSLATSGAGDTPDVDTSATMVGANSRRQTVALMLTHTFPAAGTLTLTCLPSNPPDTTDVVTELTKVVAVKVGSETH
jgi:hypothetical protein